jgi:hypothetical protein
MTRRWTAAVSSSLVLIIVMFMALHLPPFSGAVNEKTKTIRWDRLASSEPLSGTRAAYSIDFTTTAEQWPAKDTAVASFTRDTAGYEVQLTDDNMPQVMQAPAPLAHTREVVSATATIESGQGAWGLWCRGTDRLGTNRYRFLLTHSGSIGIFESKLTATGEMLDQGTGFWRLTNIDLRQNIHLEGRCADLDGLVSLTMLVNGRQVLKYKPVQILGPGYSGTEVYGFQDVPGPLLKTRFQNFTQASAN